jgi:hypothetical protein
VQQQQQQKDNSTSRFIFYFVVVAVDVLFGFLQKGRFACFHSAMIEIWIGCLAPYYFLF